TPVTGLSSIPLGKPLSSQAIGCRWDVALTNNRYCELVTSYLSIQNEGSSLSRYGCVPNRSGLTWYSAANCSCCASVKPTTDLQQGLRTMSSWLPASVLCSSLRAVSWRTESTHKAMQTQGFANAFIDTSSVRAT